MSPAMVVCILSILTRVGQKRFISLRAPTEREEKPPPVCFLDIKCPSISFFTSENRRSLPFVLNFVSSAPAMNTRDAICMSMTNSEDFDRCAVGRKGVGILHIEWEGEDLDILGNSIG